MADMAGNDAGAADALAVASPRQVHVEMKEEEAVQTEVLGEAQQEQATRFACKKCRCVLFTSADLTPHEPEQHHISARRILKDQRRHVPVTHSCSSYFLEETLPWMDDDLLAEGKIHCPNAKCHSRLGGLQWSGSQCSCGTWVTPSIKITKSRVDQVLSQPSVQIITGVMLPSTTTDFTAAAQPPTV